MFENFANLDFDVHKDLKFEPSINLKFAATTTTAPIAASEMSQVMRQCPITFSMQEPLVPVAFMSLTMGENAFISPEGLWLGDYLPAHIRRFPFILGNTDNPDQYAIMFDTDAPELNTFTGNPLYEENGEMAPTLVEVVEFLQGFQNEILATQTLVKPLLEKDVLTEQDINITQPDGSTKTFDGFRAVNVERLNALDDATLAEWTRSGLMAVIYAHLHSLENVRYLAERQGIIDS